MFQTRKELELPLCNTLKNKNLCISSSLLLQRFWSHGVVAIKQIVPCLCTQISNAWWLFFILMPAFLNAEILLLHPDFRISEQDVRYDRYAINYLYSNFPLNIWVRNMQIYHVVVSENFEWGHVVLGQRREQEGAWVPNPKCVPAGSQCEEHVTCPALLCRQHHHILLPLT